MKWSGGLSEEFRVRTCKGNDPGLLCHNLHGRRIDWSGDIEYTLMRVLAQAVLVCRYLSSSSLPGRNGSRMVPLRTAWRNLGAAGLRGKLRFIVDKMVKDMRAAVGRGVPAVQEELA